MSTDEHTILLERAAQLLDEIEGHPSSYDKLIRQDIERKDFESLHRHVVAMEGTLAQEHYHGYDAGIY